MELEAWVVNPFESEGVSKYFEGLKDDETVADIQSTSTEAMNSLPVHPDSPLAKIADEVVLEILLNLPHEDIRSFVFSGLTAINLARAHGYWRRKILIDMPFLWDLPELNGPRDFFKIYHELRRQCFATTPPINNADRCM